MENIGIHSEKKQEAVSAPAKRDSNIELYRIIFMILIVAHHYVVNSNLITNLFANPNGEFAWFYWIFGMWGKTGINCFVLITGYFMCRSNITVRKFVKLLGEVMFYNILFCLVFYLVGYGQTNPKALLINLLPIISVAHDFVSCYLVFFLLIPFLNILIHNMNMKQHLLLTLLLVSVYSVLATIPNTRVVCNYVTWFGVLYLIASYIRIYGMSMKGDKEPKWGLWFLLSLAASIASVFGMLWLEKKIGKTGLQYWFVADSNHILALTTSVCAFMWFKGLKIGYVPLINKIGASTFGVFLIHANSNNMRQWLWNDTVDCAGHYSQPLYAVAAVLIIFTACILLDMLRIKFVEKPFFRIYDKKMADIANRKR